jgi:hypothetical protein
MFSSRMPKSPMNCSELSMFMCSVFVSVTSKLSTLQIIARDCNLRVQFQHCARA